MKTSAAGRAAIAQREGNKLKAYKDTKGIWTIGVGHTAAAGAPTPKRGMTITAAQSDATLERDLANVEHAVNTAVKVPVAQNQFDALVSLAFNIGNGAFTKSTLVKRLNARDYDGAGKAFMMWNKPKEIVGRRRTERDQFLSGKPAQKKPASTKPAPAVTIPPIEPKPAPAPAPVTDKELIRRVQLGLTALKYNPGGADGVIGPLTAGAIRIFRADYHMPEGDFIDDDLISTLANAEPRKMVAARANATGNQVAAVVPEANAHWWNKWIGGSAGGGLGAAALVDAIAPTKGYMEQIRDLFTDVPGYVFLGVGAVLLLVIAYLALHGQKSSDEAYRAGDRR